MKTLNVSDIQHFSTGDGPGIRTTVFLKGCNLRCPWCHNPETAVPGTQTLRFRGGVVKTYGKTMTVGEIACDILEDAEFFAESGGGATLSGGEPLLQAQGVAELAEILLEKNVSTLVDTAGCVPFSAFETVLPYVRDFYFDLKTADADRYAEVIGGDIGLITDNLTGLVRSGARVKARIPFIPGFNDGPEDCEKLARLAAHCGCTEASLLPFHRLGTAKYEALGIDYKYKNTLPPGRDAVAEAVRIYAEYLNVNVE